MEISASYFVAIIAIIGLAIWQHRRWTPYDPSWLISMVRAQYPEDIDLQSALGRCTKAKDHGSYVYFVSASRPNQPGSEWQHFKSVNLEHPEYLAISIDVLKDGRIGGVELLRRAPKGR